MAKLEYAQELKSCLLKSNCRFKSYWGYLFIFFNFKPKQTIMSQNLRTHSARQKFTQNRVTGFTPLGEPKIATGPYINSPNEPALFGSNHRSRISKKGNKY